MPRRGADLGREHLRDIGLVPVAEGVGIADLRDRAALPDGALGGDHEGVVAGVQPVIVGQDLDQVVEVEGRLRDQAARRRSRTPCRAR